MDFALIRELFGNLIAAAEVLDADHDFAATLAATLKRLPDYQIGSYGQLQEWSVDFKENQPGQRHMSHLYPVYPGAEITPRNNPRLAKAARASLQHRLDNGGAYTGWSRAWAIGLWSRLLDGDMALGLHPDADTSQHRYQFIRQPPGSERQHLSNRWETSAQPPPSPNCCCKVTTAR